MNTEEKTHIWTRRAHQVWVDKKLEVSHSMAPCPFEEHEFGLCPQSHNEKHKNNFYHFVKKGIVGNPVYYDPISGFVYSSSNPHHTTDKLVCKYSKTNEQRLCWERHNSNHIKLYHHL